MIKETDLAYIAALVDGEGYICIRIAGTGDYQVLMAISNCCPIPLTAVQRLFGGSLTLRNRKGNRRPIWQYQTVSRKAEVLIKAIQPYLQIKGQQARIALEFLQTKFSTNPEQRQRLREEIQVLNKRGVDGYDFNK